jgi:hypothetical protein
VAIARGPHRAARGIFHEHAAIYFATTKGWRKITRLSQQIPTKPDADWLDVFLRANFPELYDVGEPSRAELWQMVAEIPTGELWGMATDYRLFDALWEQGAFSYLPEITEADVVRFRGGRSERTDDNRATWMIATGLPPFDSRHRYNKNEKHELGAAFARLNPAIIGRDNLWREYRRLNLLPTRLAHKYFPGRTKKGRPPAA